MFISNYSLVGALGQPLGTKWKKTTVDGAITTEKYYFGPIEYTGSSLEAFYHEEGRVAADGDAYEYQYALRDHPSSPLRAGLGSTRVMFKMVGSTATLIQVVAKRRSLFGKNHSYPFGMELSGPAFVGGGNPYRYNGKELNEDLGLNWLDYGARWYDPAAGRWMGVDIQAERYLAISPFAYVANNPLAFFDPNGEEVVARGKDAKRAILRSLDPAHEKFVKFDKEGRIQADRLNRKIQKLERKGGIASENLLGLQTLANSTSLFTVEVASSFTKKDSDGQIVEEKFSDLGEVIQTELGITVQGSAGATLFPDGEVESSVDGNVSIIINQALNDDQRAANFAHEALSHGYFYELKQQGEGVNPNHVAEITILDDGSAGVNRRANKRLEDRIEITRKETIRNINKRKK